MNFVKLMRIDLTGNRSSTLFARTNDGLKTVTGCVPNNSITKFRYLCPTICFGTMRNRKLDESFNFYETSVLLDSTIIIAACLRYL